MPGDGSARDELKRLRRQLELEREARAAAEAATRIRSDFLSTMSHEIRTPMNGIMGMLGRLLDSRLTEEQRELAEFARSSADALLALVNEVLEFSRIESGNLRLEAIEFDLFEIAEDVCELMAPRAQQKQVVLVLAFDPLAPSRFVGDPGRIRQILTNLVDNAVKFTGHGEIAVRLHVERGEGVDYDVTVAVEDTGIGIPPHQLATIFERFAQGDASTARTHGGAGLGLAICKRLVEVMGGSMGVSSQPGSGSRFTFGLTLSPAPPTIEPPELALDGVRVVLAMPHPLERHMLCRRIAALGARCDAMESAADALATIREASRREEPYHLAVIDEDLPEAGAEPLARVLKADPRLQKTILVALVPQARRVDADRMRDAGFSASLAKPVRRAALSGTLSRAWRTWEEWESGEMPTDLLEPTPDVEENLHKRVLVVEDNAVNQKVAVYYLRRLGCRADTASNGREALHMVELLPYDAVLMDCEMPEMDGFEATAAIRRRGGAAAALPIIAMTGHGSPVDRGRCLQSGMDGMVLKPVRLADLRRVLRDTRRAAGPIPPPGLAEALDPDVVASLREFGSQRRELLAEMATLYVEDMPRRLEGMHAALAAGDTEALYRHVHTVKGMSGNFGALRVVEICRALEAMCKAREVAEAGPLIAAVEAEFPRVVAAVRAFIGD